MFKNSYSKKRIGVLLSLCPGEENLFLIPYEISEPKKVRYFRTKPKKILPLNTDYFFWRMYLNNPIICFINSLYIIISFITKDWWCFLNHLFELQALVFVFELSVFFCSVLYTNEENNLGYIVLWSYMNRYIKGRYFSFSLTYLLQ